MVIPAPSGTSHVMDAPGLPGCFRRFFFPARSTASRCFRGGFRPGRPSDDDGIEEFHCSAIPRAPPSLQLLPEVSDHHLQHGDLLRLRRDQLRLLSDQRITRVSGRLPRRRIGHSRDHPQTTLTYPVIPRPTLDVTHDYSPQYQAQVPM